MKTITEFSGFHLTDALNTIGELIKTKRSAQVATATADAVPPPDSPPETGEKQESVNSSTPAPVSNAQVPNPRRQKLPPVQITAEDLSPALAEKLKLEAGDRLTHMTQAALVVDHRRRPDLRRVVVLKVEEGERAPKDAVQRGDYYYLAEYLRSLNPPRRHEHKGKKGRGGRGGGKKRFSKDRRRPRRPENQNRAPGPSPTST